MKSKITFLSVFAILILQLSFINKINAQSHSGPSISVSLTGNTLICSSDSTALCPTVSGGSGPYTYLWEPGGTTTLCITVSPFVSTIYTFKVYDALKDSTSVNTTVHIISPPPVSITTNPNNGCLPLCTQFNGRASGNITKWLWDFGNGDTVNRQNPIYCYPDSGTYTVSLTITDSGCSSTIKMLNLISVYSLPHAAFTYSVVSGRTIQFTDQSTDAYGLSNWIWNFGDDSTSVLQDPLHTYSWDSIYCARLVVMNVHGCVDSVTNCFTISAVPNISNEIDDLNIYPNSSSGVFTVDWSAIASQPSEIEIADELGRKVYSKQMKSASGLNTLKVNLYNITTGIYTLQIRSGDSFVTKKLLVTGNNK